MRSEQELPTSRADQMVVLLGASNLTLSWPRIMSILNSGCRGITHVYTANGMGRSYLYPNSAFGFRKLPGILCCGIWNALPPMDSSRGATSTCALITDLGNDLLYGSSAADVAQSAVECIQRLRSWSPDCRIVVTQPPVESVHRLGWLRFMAARTILFPLTRLTLASAKEATTELNNRLLDIADQHKVRLWQPNAKWYGIDPIHVRQRYQQTAFAEMLSHCTEESAPTSPAPSAIAVRPTAENRWLFGKRRHTPQPNVKNDRICVFAY